MRLGARWSAPDIVKPNLPTPSPLVFKWHAVSLAVQIGPSLHGWQPWFPELERQPRLVLGEPNNLALWLRDQQCNLCNQPATRGLEPCSIKPCLAWISPMACPPIQLFGVEGRYACALYSAASKLKQLDVVEKDLIKLQGILKTDLRLQEFIRNPILKRSLKVTAVKEIAAKVPLSVPSTNLLALISPHKHLYFLSSALLAENGRLKAVNTIINSFKTIMAAHRGEVVCEVTTAKLANALVVLSSPAEDGEIEVRISVG
uniref:Oligomycin sensitivity conferral protein n=1 Tax=Timema monikensis TaxID=170555 RepID=A0A7R9DXB1_9NEOP|nr:unnamed protein product [Timema monikensis]